MKIKSLGSSGLKVSELCLGTMQFGWRIDEETSRKVMDKALDLGIFFFDTADIYSKWAENSYAGKTEEILGKWLVDHDRSEIVLATKVRGAMSERPNDEGLSRRHIRHAIKGSLDRLQTSYIDLYQIHSFDPLVPIEETLHALSLLVDEGLVNYLGASNMPAWRLTEALWTSKTRGYVSFVSLQPKYNLINRLKFELELQELCSTYGLGVIPYSPQAAGFLTGKYQKDASFPSTPRAEKIKQRYDTERNWKILEVVKEIAQNHGVFPNQVALAWLLRQKTVTAPIIGVNSVEQLEIAVESTNLQLKPQEIERLNEISDWRTQIQTW